MTIHCDSCDADLGDYLYGKGGVEERAMITNINHPISMPDILCNICWEEGFSLTRRKKDRFDSHK